jgi:hypothetical protein
LESVTRTESRERIVKWKVLRGPEGAMVAVPEEPVNGLYVDLSTEDGGGTTEVVEVSLAELSQATDAESVARLFGGS